MSTYLHPNRLEFIVTYRCNSRCRHCQVTAAERKRRPAALSPQLAQRAVRELAAAYPLTSMMTFGGEPLLYPETVFAAHAAARDCGISSRDVITNAGVPRGEEDFRHVAQRLADSGVNYISISVDAFHEEYVPLEILRRNVRALVDVGIQHLEWNPVFAVSRDADNPWDARTRQILKELSDLPVINDGTNDIQLLPMGAALDNLAEYLPPRQPCPPGTCGDIPFSGPLDDITCISVEPDGSLTTCFDLSIGNMREKNAAEICQRYDPYADPLIKTILEGGPQALLAEAQRRGIPPDPRGYASACQMCRELRRVVSAPA